MKINYATTALIMAAGSSNRFGKNKLLEKINDKPVLAYTLEKFEKSNFINSILIVTSENLKLQISKMVKNYEITKVREYIIGGKTRQDSVRNGLEYLKEIDAKCYYISIHDGARPLIESKDIDKCIQGAVKYRAAALGIRLKDTIKKSNTPFSKEIIETVPRELLWAIQTPQSFDFNIVYESHMKALKDNFIATDDCAIVEEYGFKPVVIEGDYRNLKITTPEDLKVATVFLNN